MASVISRMPSAVLQHIPDEIWAEIFAHLSRKSLAHADLTNWRFHRITRPLLFRELEFHPYTCIAGYPVTRCPSSALALPSRPEDIDLVLQRLQFWSTESISPCVRTCRLSPWPNSGVHDRPFTRVKDPYLLLTALINAFPCFTNLRNLSLRNTHFTQNRLENLRLLLKLTVLEVDMCSVADGEVIDLSMLIPLAISHFIFIHDTSQDAIDHWLPLVRTDTLIHLELPYNARLFELLQSGDSFVSVKSLKIAGDISQTWSRILSKFPVVETLTVEAWEWRGGWSHPHIPISDLLTSLREYTGATGLMYFLLPLPTLCRLTIPFWDIDNPDILEYFQLFIPPNNITSLHAKFFDFEPQHLEGLCAVFPNLTELHVEIFIEMWGNGTPLDVDCRFEVDNLFESLAQHSPLPTNIQKLAIYWEYVNTDLAADFGCPDINELKDALISQHPNLNVLWVDGSDLMYIWRKGYDTRQYAYDESGLAAAKEQREQFHVLWNAI